jgi:hypothetical protein
VFRTKGISIRRHDPNFGETNNNGTFPSGIVGGSGRGVWYLMGGGLSTLNVEIISMERIEPFPEELMELL